jgi:peptidoglycan hydrolase-like protein with peptidoglycan-binding domain
MKRVLFSSNILIFLINAPSLIQTVPNAKQIDRKYRGLQRRDGLHAEIKIKIKIKIEIEIEVGRDMQGFHLAESRFCCLMAVVAAFCFMPVTARLSADDCSYAQAGIEHYEAACGSGNQQACSELLAAREIHDRRCGRPLEASPGQRSTIPRSVPEFSRDIIDQLNEFEARSAPPKTTGLSRLQMAKVQDLLRLACFDPGPVDGVLGTNTMAAIRDFQRQANLPPTGEVTDAFLWSLQSRARSPKRCGADVCTAVDWQKQNVAAVAARLKSEQARHSRTLIKDLEKQMAVLENEAFWTSSQGAELVAYVASTIDRTTTLILSLVDVDPRVLVAHKSGKALGSFLQDVRSVQPEARTAERIRKVFERHAKSLIVDIHQSKKRRESDLKKYLHTVKEHYASVLKVLKIKGDISDLRQVQLNSLTMLRRSIEEARARLSDLDFEQSLNASLE